MTRHNLLNEKKKKKNASSEKSYKTNLVKTFLPAKEKSV